MTETMAAVAAAGGTAVVSAAGSDVWASFRTRAARLFGRGDAGAERDALEQLDRTAGELPPAASGPTDGAEAAERSRSLERAWEGRFVDALEAAGRAGPKEQEELAGQIRQLAADVTSHTRAAGSGGTAITGAGGQANTGPVNISAPNGFAAGVQNFGSVPENPTRLGPAQA